MAQITLTYPDGQGPRIVNALATFFHYSATIRDQDGKEIPNPETKAQFTKRMIINQIKSWVLEAEKEPAIQATVTTLSDDVKNNVNVT